MRELVQHTDHVNELLARYGVKFGIYKNGVFREQLFPFDSIPRVIEHAEFARLEQGLKQRVQALNLFLADIYGPKKIVKDGVIPEEFIFISSGYMQECEGVTPPKGVSTTNPSATRTPRSSTSWKSRSARPSTQKRKRPRHRSVPGTFDVAS